MKTPVAHKSALALVGLPDTPPCRHCRQPLAGKRKGRRGLCWRCYDTPKIRKRYPPLPAAGNRGWTVPVDRLPDKPADLRKKRVDILAARAAARVSLFHPADTVIELPEGHLFEFLRDHVIFAQIKGVFEAQGNGVRRFYAYPYCSVRGRHFYLGCFKYRATALREIHQWKEAGSPSDWLKQQREAALFDE